MTNHPLTDETCETLSRQPWLQPDVDVEGTIRDMRSAYDLAIDHMSQWVEENGHEYVAYNYELGCQSNFSQMITDFKEAMRPAQENN